MFSITVYPSDARNHGVVEMNHPQVLISDDVANLNDRIKVQRVLGAVLAYRFHLRVDADNSEERHLSGSTSRLYSDIALEKLTKAMQETGVFALA